MIWSDLNTAARAHAWVGPRIFHRVSGLSSAHIQDGLQLLAIYCVLPRVNSGWTQAAQLLDLYVSRLATEVVLARCTTRHCCYPLPSRISFNCSCLRGAARDHFKLLLHDACCGNFQHGLRCLCWGHMAWTHQPNATTTST